MASDFGIFFRQFRETFETTGAIAPSSKYLGDALSKFVGKQNGVRILEVGPGTGAVTARILRRLQPDDRLELIELNEKFVEVLKSKFSDDPQFKVHSKQVTIIQGRLESLVDSEPYDIIISGLPLNNFDPTLVRTILQTYQQLLKPKGTVSFFEYMFFRSMRSVIPGRMREVSAVMQPWLSQYEFERDWIWLNVPSAWAHHVRFSK